MKNNEKFSDLMKEKTSFDITNHCETLIQKVKRDLKELMIIENPKEIMQTNEKLNSRVEFIRMYKKPNLHEMHFYPERLHELIEMENKIYKGVSLLLS